MVDGECPKIVTMQEKLFSDLHKADVHLALCMHLTEKGLSLPKWFGLPDNQSLYFP